MGDSALRLPNLFIHIMKTQSSHPHAENRAGMTLIELLVVVAIIAILLSILVPSLGKIMQVAEAAKNVNSLKNIAGATITFTVENGDKLPSPIYPGGVVVPNGKDEDDIFPEYWDLVPDSGLWLDGVIFGQIYLKEQNYREEQDGEEATTGGYDFNEEGDHLKGTVFESTASVKANPTAEDWHVHSYAMNKNLQYDRIQESNGSEDPWLTEKSRANLIFSVNAMLYIDCGETNIVEFEDRELILDAVKERWGEKGKALVAFLDGHVERVREEEIPEEDPNTDMESSRFWRGVDPDN